MKHWYFLSFQSLRNELRKNLQYQNLRSLLLTRLVEYQSHFKLIDKIVLGGYRASLLTFGHRVLIWFGSWVLLRLIMVDFLVLMLFNWQFKSNRIFRLIEYLLFMKKWFFLQSNILLSYRINVLDCLFS